MTQQGFFTRLPHRSLIKITGNDRKSFLQGLISNDINKLETQPLLYACLLTPNGKFLHDFFIFEKNNILHIECEGGDRAKHLLKLLTIYKLRADIKLELIESQEVYTLIGTPAQQPSSLYRDPRHPDMGFRAYDKTAIPPATPEKAFSAWDIHRIKLCIPDGSRDMIPEKSTLLECNIDKLNGISYEKGCYLGQELTARMHYRGLTKKSLFTVESKNLPENGEPILNEDGKTVGEMRSSCKNYGLALIKKDSILPDKKINLSYGISIIKNPTDP